jgi:hypothetical protein
VPRIGGGQIGGDSTGGGTTTTTPGTNLTEHYTALDQTAFNPGDVFTYQGMRVMATEAITGLSGANPFISASKYVVVGDAANIVIPAARFGLKANALDADATTNSTALQRACDYAEALGGGFVALPIGNTRFNGNLTLGQGVILTGAGMMGSTLQAAQGSNYGWLVANKVAATTSGKNAMFCGVTNLALDGRRDNQTAGTGYGVYWRTNPITSAAAGDSFFDPHHILLNVRVYKAYGDGFRVEGRSALQSNLIYAQQCGGWGFWSSFDTNVGYGEADGCWAGGFHFDNGSVRVGVLKAFLSGNSRPDSTAPGFYFGPNCYSFSGAALEAQNNAGPGFHLDHCKNVTLFGNAESNWKDPLADGPGPQGAGFVLDGATGCLIRGSSTQGKQNTILIGNQLNAVRLTGGATNNDVAVVHQGLQNAAVASVLTADSTATGNRVVGNGTTLAPALELQANKGQPNGYPGLDASGLVPTAVLPASTTGAAFGAGFFGDGSDGAVTFDGTATFTFATKSGNTYTLTRPIFGTTITVAAGVTVVTKGFIIYASVALTGAGTIHFNGSSATSATGGFAAIAGSGPGVLGGTAGGAGTTAAGAAGGALTGAPFGSIGGPGGAGGTGAAGAAGTVATPATSLAHAFRVLPSAAQGIGFNGTVANQFAGGSGGGGGGGDGTNPGGGGGGGAGVVLVNARAVTGTLTFQANGGNGFTPTVGNAGGGGSAGGGLVVVNCSSQSGATLQALPGTPGSGVGTGAPGVAGTAGRTQLNVFA